MKVDMARRKGGIFIVKVNWFTDSMNAWEKQDERSYLLESPPRREHPDKSPVEQPSQTVDVEGHDPGGVVQEMLDDFDDEDDDEEEVVNEPPIEAQEELEPIALGTWLDATDEVDAYLMESDSESGDGEEPSGDVMLGEGESESGR
jgi:RNA polymerase II subunit A-like phosphatase